MDTAWWRTRFAKHRRITHSLRLANLERIADHCSNIAARIIGAESDGQFDAHEMRRRLHEGYVEGFNEKLEQYKQKYLPQLELQQITQ